MRIAIIVGSALVTVLVGIQWDEIAGDGSGDVALALSVLLASTVTALTSIEAFFDHRSLWAHAGRCSVRCALLEQKVKLLQDTDGAEIPKLFQVLEEIVEEESAAWSQIRLNSPRDQRSIEKGAGS